MVGELDNPGTRAWAIDKFPKLEGTDFEITSPQDQKYNCIAWAAGDDQHFWWPGAHWPKEAPPAVTRLAFVKAFTTKGYVTCEGGELEHGYEKVVLYEKLGRPTHAARMLPDGRWTSKLGRSYDIIHSINGLNGNQYGRPSLFMKRLIDTM